MAKWGKKLLGLAAIGGAAAGLVYYLKSKEELDLDDFEDELDDDDFDLDNDLKPVGERGYVPLTPKKDVEETGAEDNEEAPEAETSDDAAEKQKGEAIAKEAEEADSEAAETETAEEEAAQEEDAEAETSEPEEV